MSRMLGVNTNGDAPNPEPPLEKKPVDEGGAHIDASSSA